MPTVFRLVVRVFALSLFLILGAAATTCILAGEFPGDSPRQADWIPDDNDEFLRLLKAKDSELNRVRVTVQKKKTVRRVPLLEHAEDSFNAYKFGGDPPSQPESYKPYELKTSATFLLTLQGNETTIERTSMFNGRGEREDQSQYSKTSNASGTTESICEAHGYRTILRNVPSIEEHGLFYEARMELEFSLGVGFGSRLESIEQIEREGELARVHGTMRIWKNDLTKAVLLVDRNLIVREAVLHADSSGHLSRFEIQTSGTIVLPERTCFAKGSQYKRIGLGHVCEGEFIERTTVLDDYSTEDHEIIALSGE
ncbi:hypothetical protein [Rubinisphaera margarita]|uniref:hypothetical protein n=1 Tax=Rubinisphaera margarita TaxID=2909586 RepID=UPI001EE787BC|nr:hypothetical protein [Rubinisphaera margarita]MCG6154242.1 hypothetical protein [Rubinisphaera margarita]